MNPFTHQSEVGAIKTLVLKHAKDAFGSAEQITRQWQPLNYHTAPDFAKAVAEYEAFIELLRSFGIELLFLPADGETTLDSIYVRDAAVVSDRGVILCNMGKPARQTEPARQKKFFECLRLPILGEISGSAQLEGGDVVWLDEKTVAVGRGYRSNDAGIHQLSALLVDCADHIEVVHLPHFKGPGDVFHLMSILSPVDVRKALVYSPLLPVAFREFLLERDFQLIEVPDEEFDSMACNVLALAPGKCLALDGNPMTRKRLEKAGVDVRIYAGDEISRKGEGGPTCLTRPLLRHR